MWLSKLRAAPLPNMPMPELSQEVGEIKNYFSPEAQAEKWTMKIKTAEDIANSMTQTKK
jgi:hypothetical protein